MRPQEVKRVVTVNAPQRGGIAEYRTLKARERELTDQRRDLEERREELAQQLNQRTGVDRAGVEQRISTMDQRLQQIETDLNDVGRQAVALAPASTEQPRPDIRYVNNDEDMVGAGFAGAFMTLMILSPFLYRSWRRGKRAVQSAAASSPVLGAERIDRMENAIESIAVEIERVAENQRFMTRLMTETQLADTLAAVRGSTEAARLAAEKATNG
jgi:hypothetical protein